MSDIYAEKTRTGCLENLFGSVIGLFVGLLLFVGSFPLESWNEQRAIESDKSLKKGASQVIAVDGKRIDPANEGRLVYLNCLVQSKGYVKDPDLGVQAKALLLKRKPQMYQWDEDEYTRTKNKIGGGSETETVYTYTKQWRDSLINSDFFKHPFGHSNPKAFRYPPQEFIGENVHMGAFKLDNDLIRQMPLEEFQLSAAVANRWNNNCVFIGKNPKQPMLGDELISYSHVPADREFSLVGTQIQNRVIAFRTSNGAMYTLVAPGKVPSSQIFKQAEEQNNTVTWLVRGLGVFLMACGIALMSGPVIAVLRITPILGDLAEFGAITLSVFLAFSISTLNIAFAWLFVRPLLAYSLAAAVFVVFALFYLSAQSRKAS